MPYQCPRSPRQGNGVVVNTGWHLRVSSPLDSVRRVRCAVVGGGSRFSAYARATDLLARSGYSWDTTPLLHLESCNCVPVPAISLLTGVDEGGN
jgi:hypothetical protein